jgi:competence protein ComEC
VGFQLSYAAVGGILGFYPYLYHMLNLNNRLLDEIWKILAVSLAAQVLTLPLSIYYFHQLPNYFLLANLLIIPLTTIIIYARLFRRRHYCWDKPLHGSYNSPMAPLNLLPICLTPIKTN